jgi:hypothetical protein
MFINCLWFIEQAWETVLKPFTMKIYEVIWIFQNIFERQGPEKGTFLLLQSSHTYIPISAYKNTLNGFEDSMKIFVFFWFEDSMKIFVFLPLTHTHCTT